MSFPTFAYKTLTALAGAGMLLSAMAAPASAMSLPTPSGAADVATPVDHVWWDRWGRWHPNYYYRPYYHPYYHPYYYHPYYRYGYRRCWRCW